MVRERLLAQLDHVLMQPLALLCAPAGAGKSTLVSQWLEAHEHPHAWLSLDTRDDRPIALLRGLLAALSPHIPELAELQLGDGAMRVKPSFTELLGQWLLAPLLSLDAPLILVLDDAHLLTHPEIWEGLAWWVEHMPPLVHLVLTSRTQPALPMARLQVRHLVTVIDRHQLRFSPQEARAFFHDTMHLELSEEDLRSLDAFTEGWAAALQLSALSVSGGASAQSLASAPLSQHRLLEEFLTQEVLTRQHPELRDFLLQTSILTRLDAASCAAVTGHPDAASLLRQLDAENLFLIPLDVQGRWWRYHHLFHELLLRHLERSDLETRELHARACRWALDEDLWRDAMHHASASERPALMLEVAHRYGRALLFRGEHDALLAWFDAMDASVYREDPMACVYKLWAVVLARRGARVPLACEEVERALQVHQGLSTVERDEVLAFFYAAQAFFSQGIAPHEEVSDLAQTALAHLDDPTHPVVALASYTLGAVLMKRGELGAAASALQRAEAAARQSGNHFLCVGATLYYARILAWCEEWASAEAAVASLLERMEQRKVDARSFMGGCAQIWGWIALQQGQLEGARRHLERSLEPEFRLSREERAHGHALLAWTLELLGEDEEAWAHVMDVERLSAEDAIPGAAHGLCALLAARRGEAGVWEDASRSQGRCDDLESRFWFAWSEAWRLVEQGALGDARAHIGAGLERATRQGARAFASLWRAYDAHVRELMGEASERAPEQGLVSVLFPATSQPAAARVEPEVSEEEIGRVEPLSERELEVLGLIARGMTNRAIASQLFITVGTVKTHVHNVLRKLDVSNRTQAVHRARRLGWIR